jgi:putative transposase
MSYRYYIDDEAPVWLKTGFILGFFGKDIHQARIKYRDFVHEMIAKEYTSPLLATVASSILGSPEFVNEIKERHLSSKKADRDLPALRELTSRPSLDEIVKTVGQIITVNSRQATKASIYICHRYSGTKLKEIGEMFQLTESGVTRASNRFEQAIVRDPKLKATIMEIGRELGMSIA